MNPTVDNDLQKAIDDITKNTNGDPVFSDPVAAPSSIPEGDLGNIAESVGPFPEETKATEPVLPQLTADQPAMEPATEAFEPPMPEPILDAEPEAPTAFPEPIVPEPTAPESTTSEPTVSDATTTAEPIEPAEPASTTLDPIAEPTYEQPAEQSPEAYVSASFEAIAPSLTDMHSIKEAALRDLAPLMDKIDMDPAKRFNLYKDIREKFNDDSVLASAYESAKNIADEKTRGEALLYLFESIKD